MLNLNGNHHAEQLNLSNNDVINPLHLNISMYILHTVLFTFPALLTKIICLSIKSFLVRDHFLDSRDLDV